MESLFVTAVVEHDVESAGDGNDELIEVFVRMASPLGASRDIVEIVDALDVKGDVVATLNKSEVPPRVRDFRQIDESAAWPVLVDLAGESEMREVRARDLQIREDGGKSRVGTQFLTMDAGMVDELYGSVGRFLFRKDFPAHRHVDFANRDV
jgi:hypothetical protein